MPWHVVHRLAHEKGFTDFLHDERYLDVWEQRDGDGEILRRIISVDLDRWLYTLDTRQAIGGPNEPLRGCRGKEDPGNLWFDIFKHQPERRAVDELSAIERDASKALVRMAHWVCSSALEMQRKC